MTPPGEQAIPNSREDPESLTAKAARLQAERDALAAELEKTHQKPGKRHRGRIRSWLAVFLVALTAILIPVAATLFWAHRTVLNTDRYVATVAPLGSDPTITDALAKQVSTQLYTALDPQPAIAKALPEKAAFLAGPISSGVQTVLNNATQKVLGSKQFATIWTEANRFAHTQLVAILRGKSKTIITQGDTVVLNLVPVLNAVIAQLQPQISGIVGKNIELPKLSGNELPSVVCEKLSAALDRPLPPTCGQIALFPASKLDAARQAVTKFDRLTVLTIVLAAVFFVLALVVSRRRRRTLLQLLIATSLGLVAFRRVVFYMQDRLTNAAKPENRAAVHDIVGQVFSRYATVTAWLLGGALAIAAVVAFTGPYPWARAARRYIKVGAVAAYVGAKQLVGALRGRAGDVEVVQWVAAHRAALQMGGAAVGILLLIVADLSPIWVLVVLLVVIGYEVAIVRVAKTAGPLDTPGETPVEPPKPPTAAPPGPPANVGAR